LFNNESREKTSTGIHLPQIKAFFVGKIEGEVVEVICQTWCSEKVKFCGWLFPTLKKCLIIQVSQLKLYEDLLLGVDKILTQNALQSNAHFFEKAL